MQTKEQDYFEKHVRISVIVHEKRATDKAGDYLSFYKKLASAFEPQENGFICFWFSWANRGTAAQFRKVLEQYFVPYTSHFDLGRVKP